MEDIDEGLHPAVDGQSLDEDDDEDGTMDDCIAIWRMIIQNFQPEDQNRFFWKND